MTQSAPLEDRACQPWRLKLADAVRGDIRMRRRCREVLDQRRADDLDRLYNAARRIGSAHAADDRGACLIPQRLTFDLVDRLIRHDLHPPLGKREVDQNMRLIGREMNTGRDEMIGCLLPHTMRLEKM